MNSVVKFSLLGFLFCFLVLDAAAQKKLTIIHTNDSHSRVVPFSNHAADDQVAGKAGYVRRAAMLKAERKKDKKLLLFDSGDFSQGSPYYTLFKGDAEVSLMNEMGYDCVTIGNHEFDYGLDNMARIFRLAKFPIVCANYDFKGTVVEGLVHPYVILKRRGIKIGVLGLSPILKGLVQEMNYEGVTFQDPSERANQVAQFLKEEEKCDLVICLSHLGWKGELGDENMIAHTRNIDLVLGGHSHSYFEKPIYYKNLDGKDVLLTQMGKNAQYVGKLVLTLEKNKHK